MDSLTQAFSRMTRNERHSVILATQSAKNRAAEQPDRFSTAVAEIYALVGNAAGLAQAEEDAFLRGAERQIRRDRRKRLGLDPGDEAASPFDR